MHALNTFSLLWALLLFCNFTSSYAAPSHPPPQAELAKVRYPLLYQLATKPKVSHVCPPAPRLRPVVVTVTGDIPYDCLHDPSLLNQATQRHKSQSSQPGHSKYSHPSKVNGHPRSPTSGSDDHRRLTRRSVYLPTDDRTHSFETLIKEEGSDSGRSVVSTGHLLVKKVPDVTLKKLPPTPAKDTTKNTSLRTATPSTTKSSETRALLLPKDMKEFYRLSALAHKPIKASMVQSSKEIKGHASSTDENYLKWKDVTSRILDEFNSDLNHLPKLLHTMLSHPLWTLTRVDGVKYQNAFDAYTSHLKRAQDRLGKSIPGLYFYASARWLLQKQVNERKMDEQMQKMVREVIIDLDKTPLSQPPSLFLGKAILPSKQWRLDTTSRLALQIPRLYHDFGMVKVLLGLYQICVTPPLLRERKALLPKEIDVTLGHFQILALPPLSPPSRYISHTEQEGWERRKIKKVQEALKAFLSHPKDTDIYSVLEGLADDLSAIRDHVNRDVSIFLEDLRGAYNDLGRIYTGQQ
ncbi:hypothetical protein BJ684DRAFT_18896 [Piptocephalis cylindrospora]|uniref:Uncharacterized protein n=1 Tax=Piptocephalis cylindrospora TaxID=1907219 RepID=A0A4P9Y7J6_9FUNG|nr:hypothetical protein BJ684DRAFT_18896 [Piptocephalis cylindrospora]|eukprot:RKP14714.1 hypothetical protein BJ684DRAFT_18896 [Piptocephalis cylindrospora]